MCDTVTPAPAGPTATHCAILEPLLETVPARCRLCHRIAAVVAALCQDPAHQHLLQLGVILPVDLLLHLPAQPVRWTPVCHADSRGVCRDGTPSVPLVALEHPAWHGGGPANSAWQSPILPGRPAQSLITHARRCPGSALFLPSWLGAGTGSVPTQGQPSPGRVGSTATPLCPAGLHSEHPHPTAGASPSRLQPGLGRHRGPVRACLQISPVCSGPEPDPGLARERGARADGGSDPTPAGQPDPTPGQVLKWCHPCWR